MAEPADTSPETQDVVRILSAGLGLDGPMAAIPGEVVELARAGRTVEAVKALRQAAPGRLSLLSAERMVDALREAR